MRKIAIVNNKGGVAKTTNVLNLGTGLAQMGKRVLLIDCEPQGSLSIALGVSNAKVTTYDILNETASAQDAIVHTEAGCDIIPANRTLAAAERQLLSVTGFDKLLMEAIAPIETNYDYIFVDCPPSLTSPLTQNALVACTEIFIPIMPDFLSSSGAGQLKKEIEPIQKRVNKDIKVTGIIFSKFKRSNLSRDMMDMTMQEFGDVAFRTVIADLVDIAASPGYGMSIYQYSPNSKGAQQYRELCEEVIAQEVSNG